jgi:hypothetical protein
MASEPITLFSNAVRPAQVLAAIRERYPAAGVVGDGNAWREITLSFDTPGGPSWLTLVHDPSYYAGPDWPRQVAGMQGYFDRFPAGGELKARVLALVGTFHFALGTRFEPDYDDPATDDRFAVLCGVTRLLDGVIFTPSGLRDADGRVLVDVEGFTDPAAAWPAVRAEAPAVADGVLEAGPEGPRPPDVERVARRAVALMGVTARAVIEREIRSNKVPAKEAAHMHQTLTAWLADLGVEDEFEPAERAVVRSTPGTLTEQQFVDAMWRIEGLAVLAWALKKAALPRYDALADIDSVWGCLGFLKPEESKQLLASAELRPAGELDAYRKQALGFHWRLRDYIVNPKVMDFRAFVADCWFGSFDVSIFELVDGDLAFRGARIDRLKAAVRSTALSIARERHHAINWLCSGPETYSQTHVGT